VEAGVIWAWGKMVVVLTTDVICENIDEPGEYVAVVVTDEYVESVVAGTACAKGDAALAMEGGALLTLGKKGELGGGRLFEFPAFPWLGGICGAIMSG
jgi:hypothetical protein